MTTPQQVLSDPLRGLTPHLYRIWHKSQHCHSCGSVHSWTELYEVFNLQSRWGTRTVPNMRPVRGAPQYRLPVEIKTEPTQETFLCHECPNWAALNHLPVPAPIAPPETPRSVPKDAPKVATATARAPSPAQPKTSPLDLFLSLKTPLPDLLRNQD